MTEEKVLIIDDEPDIRDLLSITLQRMGIQADVAENVKKAIHYINTHEYFLVLTDMKLPDGDGFGIVEYIQKHSPNLPVAVITAYGNIRGAVNTLKAGAFDYVSKPIDLPMLKSLVNTALKMYKRPDKESGILIGNSKVIKNLRASIKKLARSQAPVFIYGESGVGKELVARLIHSNSPRSDEAFIAVNCGAIPSELMESEFFGHKKGSFTGAVSDKLGLFKAAEGGTLFLDEVAELPLPMQVKLLRAIQEKAIKPIGEESEAPVDVRILSASNKNLVDQINQGQFRQELYYRINVIELRVPTLAERTSDIPLLTEKIVHKLSLENDLGNIKVSEKAIEVLKRYPFPGNVRELENILERALALCNGNTIQPNDLKLPTASETPTEQSIAGESQDRIDLNIELQEQEKDLILQALEKTRWNRTAAAKLLGISFRTLRYRLKKFDIE